MGHGAVTSAAATPKVQRAIEGAAHGSDSKSAKSAVKETSSKGRAPCFNKAEVIAKAKTSWGEQFEDIDNKIEETRTSIATVLTEDEGVGGDKTYRSHIDMLHVRHFLFTVVATAPIDDSTLVAVRARTSKRAPEAIELPVLHVESFARHESRSVVEKVQDFGLYMAKLDSIGTVAELKAKVAQLESCDSKADYTTMHKEMQQIKAAILSCIKETNKVI